MEKNVYSIQLPDGSGPIRNITRTELSDIGEEVGEDSDSDVIVDKAMDIYHSKKPFQ